MCACLGAGTGFACVWEVAPGWGSREGGVDRCKVMGGGRPGGPPVQNGRIDSEKGSLINSHKRKWK